MQLPAPDYKACLHILSEPQQREGPVAAAIELATALETTAFGSYWSASVAPTAKDLISKVAGFTEAVRAYIQHVLTVAYIRLPKAVLAESLRLDGPALEALVAARVSTAGWSIVPSPAGDILVLPRANESAAAAARPLGASIKFDEVAALIHAA